MPDVPDLAAFALAHDALYLRALRSAAEAIRRDPTVPVPITDLLAAIEVDDERPNSWQFADDWTWISPERRDLIVRGVRALAARVETLEQENRDALRAVADAKLAIAEAEAANTIARAEVDYARAALAGQSTTETPS